MKKILLLLTMLIGTAISLPAAEASYSITFKKSTNNTTAATTGNFNTSNNIESGMEYIKIVTECTKIYPRNTQGLKFGSGSGNGTLTFDVADDVASYKVTGIVLTCTKYGSDTGKLNVKYGDISGQDKTPPASEGELEWKFDQPTAISSISISTTTKRAYVSKITVYYETEAQPLGEITASINGKPLTIESGEVMVTVPAMNGAEQSSLTVSCPNAETIALTTGETKTGDTYTLPIAFTKGEAEYNFSISNGKETKSLYIYATELGVPVLKDGETTLNGNSIMVEANKAYTVSAVNAESITVKKDETDVPLTNNTITFTQGGTYVFTATAGDFSTTSTYDVTIANTNTPATPVVTLNGTTLTAGETSALLNSTISISCTDATSIKVGGVNGETIIPSNQCEYKITKPGEYTIYGVNENAPAGSQESSKFTVTFTLTLGNPEIRVGGKVAGTEITLPVGGGEIELVAIDAEGNNAVASFDYKVGEGETQNVTGNKLTVTEAGTYTFTAHSADNAVSTASFTATINIAKAEVYVRATNVADLYDGAKVIIVCEENGYAAGTTGSALDLVNAGIDKSGKWTYDDAKGVGRFVLKGTGVTNQYAFQMGEEYFYAIDKNDGTGIMSAGSTLENKFKFNVSFDENGANLNPLSKTERRVYFFKTQDVRTYKEKTPDAHYVQLYVIQPAPKMPALTVNGEAVTDFSKEITVKVGEKAVFTSEDATKMKVNGVEYAENPYTVTFAESDFTDGAATYTVSGVNETGESEALTVTFKLDLIPAAPVVKIGEQVVEGNAVEVQPGDVMTVTAAEGTTLVYTKADGAETTCDGNSFSYTFTTADYILGADGTVSATPVAYTFKAKKGDLVSDVATLAVTVREPAIPNVYRLVTSNADLQDGKKYLLVAMGENKVASNNYTGTQIDVVADAVTPENNRINATDEMMVLELEWQAETKDWRIKSNNISGKDGYYYMYVDANVSVDFNTSDAAVDNFTISVDRNSGTVDIKRNVEGVQRMILYQTTSNCFKNYAESNKDNTKDYSQVQLYVQEENGLNAGTFAEFTEQSELHPGKEVKFVAPLAIEAHYGNEMWMEDKNGTPVYATYNKDTFADYLMDELNANRTFRNFSGKAKVETTVTDNAPVYVEITSVDVAYEMKEPQDARTGKVPYFEDITGETEMPVFGEAPAWWSFGQIQGTIATHDGKTTLTATNGGTVYTVLTDLADNAPQESAAISHRRYENQNSFEWIPGDNTYFVDGVSYKDKYLVGTIMPDNGVKAILAMAVSGTQVTTGVETPDADVPEAVVDVYNMQGMRLRSGVRRVDALRDLPAGIYIVGGKKVLVKQ